MTTLPPAPTPIEASAAHLLREALVRAAYDERVFRVIGPVGDAGWKGTARSALSRLPTPECGTLVRFFIVRDEVSAHVLASALGGAEVIAALEHAGIAEQAGEGVWRSRFVLLPAAGTVALSDAIEDPGREDVPEEYILPVGLTTRYVDDLAVRLPCDLAVDLACGQGFHALRGLMHAHRCIATDINPRAIAFAQCNASLVGATRAEADAIRGGSGVIECRLGSFFEPLQDVKGGVGLLTCNPPFIILPRATTVALVSGMEGDAMLEHLVRTTPGMLREGKGEDDPDGGWAALVGLWEHAGESDWPSRVAGWLAGSGCDAMVMQFRTYRPDEYFYSWIAPEARAGKEADWRDLCARRSIGAITFGGIVMHRRTPAPAESPNWVAPVFTPINLRTGPAGEQLRGFFRTQTRIRGVGTPSPASLLDWPLRVAAGWRFDPAQGMPRAPQPSSSGRGLGLPLAYAAHYEPLLPAFDGARPAREVLSELHAQGRITVPPEHPQALAMLHTLIASGAVEVAR